MPGSRPVVLRPSSVMPQTTVSSEPAYVVGTAAIGKPLRQRDGLRETHRRAAADRDEAVGAELDRLRAGLLGTSRRDVDAHADERTARSDRREQALGVGRLRPAGDHERPREAQARELVPAGLRPLLRRRRSGAPPSR